MHYERLTKNRIYIFSAHDEMQRSADAAFRFQQDPYFFWLTDFNEPGWRLVVNTYDNEQVLLAPKRDAVKTLFDGSVDNETIQKCTGVKKILEYKEQADFLRSLAKQHATAYMIGSHPDRHYFQHHVNPAAGRARRTMERYFKRVIDCRKELDALRACKTKREVQTMRQAIDATIVGFNAAKNAIQTSAQFEYEIEAELSYAFRKTGAGGHAYDPIVASAGNACTLHYSKNNAKLPENGLVLIDAGAVMDGYAADITRTYALGVPTKRERAVHAAVEKAHHAIIALIQPGVLLKDYIAKVDALMIEALKSVGLYEEPNDYRKYFPHAISHGLGIDVHESLGGYGEFKPGMVLTVEPGIYIPEEGIGVRIEDDILVTETGNKNLSGALPTSL